MVVIVKFLRQPNLILSVEKEELGINAGLQDRVIQTYGGLLYMDFSKELLDERGYGDYIPLDPSAVWPKNNLYMK